MISRDVVGIEEKVERRKSVAILEEAEKNRSRMSGREKVCVINLLAELCVDEDQIIKRKHQLSGTFTTSSSSSSSSKSC